MKDLLKIARTDNNKTEIVFNVEEEFEFKAIVAAFVSLIQKHHDVYNLFEFILDAYDAMQRGEQNKKRDDTPSSSVSKTKKESIVS